MTWEYLQTKILDPRMMLVAGYLHGKTKGTHIIDLDCGTSRILDFIDHDFTHYKGNDTKPEFLRTDHDNTSFYDMDDKDFAKKIELCDILLVFGHGASSHPLESSSIDNSIITIVNRCKPNIVVLEGLTNFQQKFNMLGRIADKLIDYDRDMTTSLTTDPCNDWTFDKGFANRTIMILTRKTSGEIR